MRGEEIRGDKYKLAGIGVFQKGETVDVYAEFCAAAEKTDRVYAAQVKTNLIGQPPGRGVVGSPLDRPRRIRLSLQDFGGQCSTREADEVAQDLGREKMLRTVIRMLDMRQAVIDNGSYALLPLTSLSALPDEGRQPRRTRRENVAAIVAKLKHGGFGERARLRLCRAFMEAARHGDAQGVARGIEKGVDINYQDPRSLQTALHGAAATSGRDVVRLLVATNKCDYLLRDGQGRLASELAEKFGTYPAVTRLLKIKERQQAATASPH